MSGKPPVYPGVRVKITVKELLQRQRAREANSKKPKTISHTCLDLQVLCASTFPSRCVDAPQAAPAPEAHQLQLRAPAAPTGSCNQIQAATVFSEAQQPFVESILPLDGYGGGGSCNGGGGGGHADSGYNTPLPPPPAAFQLPWCQGLSPETDYSGMAPCSPAESLKLYSPMDYNSYSPQDSFSSSSSSCYDSPTRAESGYGGFSSDFYHSQHCNVQDCYCLPHCWLGPQESLPTPDYAPYYPPNEYSYACPAEESYFRSNLAMSSEMCYNAMMAPSSTHTHTYTPPL